MVGDINAPVLRESLAHAPAISSFRTFGIRHGLYWLKPMDRSKSFAAWPTALRENVGYVYGLLPFCARWVAGNRRVRISGLVTWTLSPSPQCMRTAGTLWVVGRKGRKAEQVARGG